MLGRPIDLPAAWAMRIAEGKLVEGHSFHRLAEASAVVGGQISSMVRLLRRSGRASIFSAMGGLLGSALLSTNV